MDVILSAMVSARVSGLQAAQLGVVAQLEAWRAQFSAREYAVLLDLIARIVAAELERNEAAQQRWAA